MKLSVLIGLLESNLQKHKEHSPIIQASNPAQRETYFTYLETQLTLRQMETLIGQLKQFDGDAEITANHTKIITDFLKMRWDRIKNTNAIYSIELNSHANQMCKEAAEFLAKHLGVLVDGKSHFALMMPTVKSWHSSRAGMHDIDTRYPHNFLMTDDSQYCIEIGYLKESLKGGKLVLSHKESGTERRLSDAEVSRVREHSKGVRDYYTAMTQLLRQVGQNSNVIADKKLDLREALSKADYGKYGIGSTYGEQGKDLLRKNLLHHVNELFATKEQLFDYMAEKLRPSEWETFLARLSKETLDALVMQGGALERAIKSSDLANQGEFYIKAAAFCLVETYWRGRNEWGTFSNYPAYIHRQGYDKSSKENACKLIKDFLVKKSLSGWDVFVDALEDSKVAGAIKSGTVGRIGSLIQAVNQELSAVDHKKTGISILRK